MLPGRCKNKARGPRSLEITADVGLAPGPISGSGIQRHRALSIYRTQGASLLPRSVRVGQHNRRAKEVPTRAAVPST